MVSLGERLVLKGFLISTWVPSSERLWFKFEVPLGEIDIEKVVRELTSIYGKVRVESNRRKKTYKISIPVLREAAKRLERIRNKYFDWLKEYCIVIQKIEATTFYRNIYLLPADNLREFMKNWEKLEKTIESINKLIEREVTSKSYEKTINVLEKLGLSNAAEELRRKRIETIKASMLNKLGSSDESGWIIPKPRIRLDRLHLRLDDVADMVEDPTTRRKVQEILERQYKEQIEQIMVSIRDQIKEIVRKAVESKKLEALMNARKEILNIAKKADSLGLTGIAETARTIADKIVKVQKETLSEEIVDEAFQSARLII